MSANELDQLTFYASRRQAVFVLLGGMAFVVAGYFMRSENPVTDWVAMLFFGACALAGLMTLLSPRSMYVRLDRDGFELCGSGNKSRVKWTDVTRFDLGTFNHVQMIAIVFAPHYARQTTARTLGKSLAGMEGAIPNIYTVPPEELVVMLNDWRTKYGGSDAQALERLAPR